MTPAPPAPPLTAMGWLRWDVVERLLPANARTVLEVGCGQGAVGVRLAARFDYLGLEPDPASAAVARARLAAVGRGEIREEDVARLPADTVFDVVCAFEVIEHIEDDRAAIAEWVRRLAPGGMLMVSTPAHPQRFGAMDEFVGHYRRYEPAALAQLLGATGLVDVETVLYGMPLGYALEAGREVIGKRLLARDGGTARQERTGRSGRLLQPRRSAVGSGVRLVTAPFRRVQRLFPDRGPGVIAVGRQRSETGSAG